MASTDVSICPFGVVATGTVPSPSIEVMVGTRPVRSTQFLNPAASSSFFFSMLGPFRHRLGRWAKNQWQRYILRQPPTHVRVFNVWLEALVGQVERQGWRSPVRAAATSFVDIVFDGPPGPRRRGSSRSRTTRAEASGMEYGCSGMTGHGCYRSLPADSPAMDPVGMVDA
jgi:hypothetical protein